MQGAGACGCWVDTGVKRSGLILEEQYYLGDKTITGPRASVVFKKSTLFFSVHLGA